MHLGLQAEVQIDADEEDEEEQLTGQVRQVQQNVVHERLRVVEALRVQPPNQKASQNGRVNANCEEYVPQA